MGGYAVLQEARPTEPLELARRLHDTVAQRLAGVSYLLSTPHEAREDALDRCRIEIDAALVELRDALSTVGAARKRDMHAELASELDELRRVCPDVLVQLPFEEVGTVHPASLVGGFLVEAIRNIRKHARPSLVTTEILREPEILAITVVNDGVTGERGPSCGAGRRLLELEASLHGGLVESSPGDPGTWCQRLILPVTEVAAS
jgi:signal transduction histidine kinase